MIFFIFLVDKGSEKRYNKYIKTGEALNARGKEKAMGKYGYKDGSEKTIKGLFLSDDEIALLKKHEIEVRNVKTGSRLRTNDWDYLRNCIGNTCRCDELAEVAAKFQWI